MHKLQESVMQYVAKTFELVCLPSKISPVAVAGRLVAAGTEPLAQCPRLFGKSLSYRFNSAVVSLGMK
jgi:hypothetical protein